MQPIYIPHVELYDLCAADISTQDQRFVCATFDHSGCSNEHSYQNTQVPPRTLPAVRHPWRHDVYVGDVVTDDAGIHLIGIIVCQVLVLVFSDYIRSHMDDTTSVRNKTSMLYLEWHHRFVIHGAKMWMSEM